VREEMRAVGEARPRVIEEEVLAAAHRRMGEEIKGGTLADRLAEGRARFHDASHQSARGSTLAVDVG